MEVAATPNRKWTFRLKKAKMKWKNNSWTEVEEILLFGKENAWENWIKFFLWKSSVVNFAIRSLPTKRAGLGGHSRMVRGFDIHVAAADVSLTDASLRSNTLTSQDLTSLTSTSTSMVPTLMSIYLLLIQHVQYSLLRQLFHLLCQASGLPGLVRLTWRVPGQICYRTLAPPNKRGPMPDPAPKSKSVWVGQHWVESLSWVVGVGVGGIVKSYSS